MDVILLERVENLGMLGDKVHVKPGYARNFLIPSGKAVMATRENLAEFEQRRAELEKQAADELQAAQARKAQLEELAISITGKAGDEGRLFGSVGPADIVEAVADAGVEIDRREVRLPDGPLHHTGEYEIQIHLHTDVDATLKLSVTPESAG